MSQFPEIERIREISRICREELTRQALDLRRRIHKPVTKENIFYHYLPLSGTATYSLLCFNCFFPHRCADLYNSLGLPEDMLTSLALVSTSCFSLHLYSRQTLAGQPLTHRAGYSVFHSSLFVLGSLLGWAMTSRIMPYYTILRLACALSSPVLLLRTVQQSLDHIDSRLGNTLGRK